MARATVEMKDEAFDPEDGSIGDNDRLEKYWVGRPRR